MIISINILVLVYYLLINGLLLTINFKSLDVNGYENKCLFNHNLTNQLLDNGRDQRWSHITSIAVPYVFY